MDLVTTYVSAVAPDARRGIDTTRLEEQLYALCTAAQQTLSELHAGTEDFVRDLARHLGHEALPSSERGADLAIAFSAARNERRGLEILDAILVESVRRGTARIDGSTAFVDLVAQELRARLLVGDPPRIRDYAGRGPLRAWLLIAARRVALNLRRGAGEAPKNDLSSKLCATSEDPELVVLRTRYKAAFEDALRIGLTRLGSQERMALCLTLRDGLSSAQLANLSNVSPATAKRMLVRARETLLAETRRELNAKLGLTTSEFESVARAVYRDVELSIVRLLEE